MLWLLIGIFSYFLLAVVTIGDAYFLQGPFLSSKAFAFYVGILGILIVLLIPFFGFPAIDLSYLLIALFSGFIFLFYLLFFYYGIRFFESSRMVPATGGLTPAFTLILSFLFFKETGVFDGLGFFAIFLLIFGSILINFETSKSFSYKALGVAVVASVFSSFGTVMSKMVYNFNSFWTSFFWITIGGAVGSVILFFLSKQLRLEVYSGLKSKEKTPKKSFRMTILFFINKVFGAGGSVLQNVAIFLAPPLYIAVVPALQGVQYLFLIFFAVFISSRFPHLLKENVMGRSLKRKILSTLFIGLGVALLAFGS